MLMGTIDTKIQRSSDARTSPKPSSMIVGAVRPRVTVTHMTSAMPTTRLQAVRGSAIEEAYPS
jgi:hypothetical protein